MPWLLVLLFGAAAACEPGPTIYPAHGIVHDVQVERSQVLIEHDDIEGLMSAMTMSFAVPDPKVLARLRPGQIIDFDLAFDGSSYDVVGFEIVGQGAEEDGWVRFGDARLRSDPAPAFELTDQGGQRVSLDDLRGLVLVVDFIFTQCPGPCPILTSTHVRAQRLLPGEVKAAVRFVSISLDPENDTPEAMTAYALERGADLSGWSFLTGTREELDPVVMAFGVGRTRDEQGEIEHTVITYLVDGSGRIVKRYFGLDHDPSEIAEDAVTLVRSP